VRLVVIDENAAIHDLLYRDLAAEGCEVEVAQSGNQGLEELARRVPDAVIITAQLHDVAVLDICRRIRNLDVRMPVLIIGERDVMQERIGALDAGADDFLPRPVDRRELSARLKALLRRTQGSWPDPVPLSVANVSLDPVYRGIAVGRLFAELTQTEYGLMELFLTNPNSLLPYGQIYAAIWPDRSEALTTLRVYVGYLRGKLAEVGGDLLIEAITGRGYVMREVQGWSGGSTQRDIRSGGRSLCPRASLARGI
jgi:two-component system response regulator MprA